MLAQRTFDNKQRGFTLIELMVVIAIIGILMLIVYPGYLNMIQKSRRADGKTGLLDAQARLERCYTSTFAYDHVDCTNAYPMDSPEGFYTIALNAQTSSYTISAQAQGKQAGDDHCALFMIDELGTRTSHDSSDNVTNDCW